MEVLREVKKVLSRLSSTESQLENAAQRLAMLLCSSSSTNDTLSQLQEQAFQMSLVKALLGIVGSSDSPSLLAECVRCLALLVHGNDEARAWLGEFGAVSLLIDLLSPRSLRGSEKRWHHEWVPVYAQVLIALRKLTYLNEDNQQKLAVIGGIKLILSIVKDENILTNFKEFPVKAKSDLESLVLEQTLVSRVQPATDAQKLSITSYFSAFSHKDSISASYYPVFNIVPLDSQNNPISNTLLDKGVVWRHPFLSPPETKLTRVRVTCVEDGGHLWCQFLSKKQKEVSTIISDTLTAIPPPTQGLPSHPLLLTPGDVYVAYVDPGQWIRARLLSLETPNDKASTNATVLSVDYGYSVTIPTNYLQGLPSKCRGIPPQAIPCKVVGVRPPPASLVMLENAAAVLRNVAFEMLVFRKEIMNFQGIETLLKMVQYPHKPTVIQALGALLNMSVSAELREAMGRRGAVKTLLEMCSEVNECDAEILQQVICCLYNVVLDCASNVSLLLETGGGRVLVDLLSKQLPHKVSQCLIKLVQTLPSSKSGTVANGMPSHWTARQDSAREMKSRLNGNKTHSRAVCQVLDSDEGSDFEEADSEPCVEGGQSDDLKVYSVNKPLPACPEESSTRSFVSVDSIDDITISLLRRTVCAFVNTGKECTVHIGVERGGTVRGVKVQRKQRDLLSIAIDQLMSNFTPGIYHSQYSVQFVPVVSAGQRRGLDDVFVLELTVKKSAYHQVYTMKEKNEHGDSVDRCYYRFGPFNETLSCQELRDTVARQEADRFKAELEALDRNILRLKTAVKAHDQ